jgi:hypothetical protein
MFLFRSFEPLDAEEEALAKNLVTSLGLDPEDFKDVGERKKCALFVYFKKIRCSDQANEGSNYKRKSRSFFFSMDLNLFIYDLSPL